MENKIKIDFSYTDEYGQENKMTKIHNDSVFVDKTSLEFLLDEFKIFLKVCGFTEDSVNTIQIVED